MQIMTFFSILALSLGIVSTPPEKATPPGLNGTWIPVRQEMAGKQLPPAAFEKQELIIDENRYQFTAESVDKGEVRYGDQKLDIYGKEGVNKGKHFTAIYKLADGELTICYNLAGDAYPEVFDTKGKPRFFLSVFKRTTSK
jgi:uncharacterized protein (TIGR03067 family)